MFVCLCRTIYNSKKDIYLYLFQFCWGQQSRKLITRFPKVSREFFFLMEGGEIYFILNENIYSIVIIIRTEEEDWKSAMVIRIKCNVDLMQAYITLQNSALINNCYFVLNN